MPCAPKTMRCYFCLYVVDAIQKLWCVILYHASGLKNVMLYEEYLRNTQGTVPMAGTNSGKVSSHTIYIMWFYVHQDFRT